MFYTHRAYEDVCNAFWENTLADSERQQFRDFLAKLNYDASNDFLCVNEMQAYFTTERQMFGWAASTGAAKGGKGGGSEWAAILPLQRKFVEHIRKHVPTPYPALTGCKCLYDT